MESIISALIAGGLALIGVVFTNYSSNRTIEHKLEKAQAITDTKLDILTKEVQKHNGFAERMPVVEAELSRINKRLEILENNERDRSL